VSDETQQDTTEQTGTSDDASASQDVTPEGVAPDASNADAPAAEVEQDAEDTTSEDEPEFELLFGHLEGDAFETARRIWDANRRLEAEVNDNPGFTGE
jgi:hypothetical protein